MRFETFEHFCEFFNIEGVLLSDLFAVAITHSSLKGQENYEKLEFLGDAILNMCIAKLLFEDKKCYNEAEMSKLKSFLVSAEICSAVCYDIGLDIKIKHNNLLLDNNLLPMSITADCMEAVISVIYQIYGESKLCNIVRELFFMYLQNSNHDPKTYLQEYAHQKYKVSPIYELIDKSGSDHAPLFTVRVKIGALEEIATGRNKKLAEKNAASKMINRLF